jgi:hypothetical protein
MSPFARLGLSEDADEAQIKRAYARELRLARPDEDPQAFQRLHEAYLRCLELAQRKESLADVTDAADVSDDTAPEPRFAQVSQSFALPATQPLVAIDPQWRPAAESPLWNHSHRSHAHGPQPWPALAIDTTQVPLEAEAAFDIDQFTRDLFRYLTKHTPEQLDSWLRSHSALYNVERKQALGPHVLAFLDDRPTLYPRPLEVILRFFDLDGLQPGRAWMNAAVDELRERARNLGEDFSELRFQSSRPQRSNEQPPWAALLLLMFVCLTVFRAFKGMIPS